MTSLTLAQRTNADGFPKPGELIEITGAHELEACDRAILNTLYQHAHDSGRLADPLAEWEILLGSLRPSTHESNDRVRYSMDRLMRVVVAVPYIEAGEERIMMTHLLDFVDFTAAEAISRATIRFGIPRRLQPIIARSGRWGRIKAEVVCAMTSKYAIALYELIQLRANMDRSTETFPLARFRDLLGVPPGAYKGGNHFTEKVIRPAVLEVNGLSDMGVAIDPNRRSPRAPIEAVTVAWWKKGGDEFRAALRERDRSKVGRMARLRGNAVLIAS